MKYKKWVIFFSSVIILCAVLSIIIVNVRLKTKIASVYQNGALIWQEDLSKITEPIEFTVTDEQGHSNTIRAEYDKIRIIAADCPDQLCVKQGYITDGIIPVVCLPHKVTVAISSKALSVDAVVGEK